MENIAVEALEYADECVGVDLNQRGNSLIVTNREKSENLTNGIRHNRRRIEFHPFAKEIIVFDSIFQLFRV